MQTYLFVWWQGLIMVEGCGHCRTFGEMLRGGSVHDLEGSPVCRHRIVWDASDANAESMDFPNGNNVVVVRPLCGISRCKS